MGEIERIRKLVTRYIRLCGTTSPERIARTLKIEIQSGDLGAYSGCYMFLKNHRCIFINESLEGAERQFVLAHELGHALMHRKQNCYFLRSRTYLNSKIEQEANTFAALLVITDDFLKEHTGFTACDIAELYGCDTNTVERRLLTK